MIKKTLRLAVASLGLASAQSWSDNAGVCKTVLGEKNAKNFKEEGQNYYPNKEVIAIDDQSLQEMVFEFDAKKEDDEEKRGAAKCFYFVTQVGPDGKATKTSDRFCVDDKAKTEGDKKKDDPTKGYQNTASIPLWNVEKISTNVVLDTQQVTDMSFHMRYNNFSDPKGFYQYDQDKINAALGDGTLPADVTEQQIKDYIAKDPTSQKKQPAVLIDGEWSALSGSATTWSEFTALDGRYMQKFWNISMIKYDDIIAVKLVDKLEAEVVPIPGCSVDILTGNTIKGAKFFLDSEADNNLISNFAVRLQPLQEYYDTTHSYMQNGDVYSVGYDNDFYDGKVEYTANGYSPQSISWKLSRSLSTSVVTSALTIAGALIGSWAF